MKKISVLSLMFIGIGCAQPQNQGGTAVELDRYTNRKFLYSVGFPKGLLIPHGETPNGDGQTFESKDKKFRLVVWGEPQPDNVTAKTECERSIKVEQAKHPFKATYKAAKDDWCVFSGLIGDTIIYQKMFVDGAKSKTIRLEYPVAERIPFDSVVRRVVSSFESYRRVSAKVANVDLANGELSFEPDVEECCPFLQYASSIFETESDSPQFR